LQISNIPSWVTISWVTGVCLFALWKGGPHERAVAAILQAVLINGFGSICRPIQGLPADLVLLAVCLACALRSRSYWTIWASAAYLLSVITDIVYLTNPQISRWTYLSAGLVWGYTLTAALLLGTLARLRHLDREAAGAPALEHAGAISRASR